MPATTSPQTPGADANEFGILYELGLANAPLELVLPQNKTQRIMTLNLSGRLAGLPMRIQRWQPTGSRSMPAALINWTPSLLTFARSISGLQRQA